MSKEKGTIYLAYGSNLNLRQMAYRCPTAKVLGSAKLTGYRLLFRGGNGGAVATIEKQKGESVPVMLWRIMPNDEKRWTDMKVIRIYTGKKRLRYVSKGSGYPQWCIS
jgi:hypothetical protein